MKLKEFEKILKDNHLVICDTSGSNGGCIIPDNSIVNPSWLHKKLFTQKED